MFADEIRRAAEAAARIDLPAVSVVLWRALVAGQVTEAEAEELDGLIEARKAAPLPAAYPRTSVGSRPRTDASMDRRRRWAASGRLPPRIAAHFTLAEQAVLALIAAEVVCRKDCRLAVGHLAAVVGVSETTVRNAVRGAVKLGLVTVEERKIAGWRNDTNVIRIVSAEWTGWLRLTRKKGDRMVHVLEGGGCKFPKPTSTQDITLGISRTKDPSQKLPKGSGRPRPEWITRNR